MATGPLYLLMDSYNLHPNTNKQVQAYVIDRTPQGPLATYVEDQNQGCQPCGLKSSEAGTPERKVIRLPEEVKRSYRSSTHAHYVNRYTLPGFLTWCAVNGYDTVDMRHVMNIDYGIWIQYSDGNNDAYRSLATRSAPASAMQFRVAPSPRHDQKKKNPNRVGMLPGARNADVKKTKEAKIISKPGMVPGAKKVAKKIAARRLRR